MGFGGHYTFRNVRTSLVHYTKDISPKKRERVHRAMCHSEAVASKFYKTQNTAAEAAEVRVLQVGSSPDEMTFPRSPPPYSAPPLTPMDAKTAAASPRQLPCSQKAKRCLFDEAGTSSHSPKSPQCHVSLRFHRSTIHPTGHVPSPILQPYAGSCDRRTDAATPDASVFGSIQPYQLLLKRYITPSIRRGGAHGGGFYCPCL
ncbi:uncharacterized protein LOC111190294 [Astyanax mexicanus]|uniref:uncharacterized protein LOC111190294 n=1 Tax=Astyanax mexicanus TaxID=7994 RepID=UPI0020CB50A0|nr:uncharacterized protein LOC111190294 [Astyanax mexicanus]